MTVSPKTRRTQRLIALSCAATVSATALVLVDSGTASAGMRFGTVDASYSPTPAKQGDNVSLLVTGRPDPSVPVGNPTLRTQFNIDFDSRVLHFQGARSGETCKVLTFKRVAGNNNDSAVLCSEAPSTGVVTDRFFFAVNNSAPLGTMSGLVTVGSRAVGNNATASLEVVAAPSHCGRHEVNIQGFCVPEPLTDLVTSLGELRALRTLSPAAKRLLAFKILRGATSDTLAFVKYFIDVVLANQGSAG